MKEECINPYKSLLQFLGGAIRGITDERSEIVNEFILEAIDVIDYYMTQNTCISIDVAGYSKRKLIDLIEEEDLKKKRDKIIDFLEVDFIKILYDTFGLLEKKVVDEFILLMTYTRDYYSY